MQRHGSIRIATYNVHKCRGLDRRVDPVRIAQIIASLDADIIAVQEVVGAAEDNEALGQPEAIAEALPGYEWRFGANRTHLGRPYGNLTLSRLPVKLWKNYDITWRKRERRGVLRTDVETRSGEVVHVFNVHLGTSFIERRHQGRKLVSAELLGHEALTGPRVVAGDFNEWTRGLASRLMAGAFDSVDLRAHLRYARTYPGVIPILHLDHFYFDWQLKLRNFRVHRARKSLVASDHLPIVAEFAIVPNPP